MAETKVTADGATVKTQGRTFSFSAQGALESVQPHERTRTFSAADVDRLKNVGEPGHENGHPLFEGIQIAMKNAALHAAGQDMTSKPESAAAPKAALKPEGWKH